MQISIESLNTRQSVLVGEITPIKAALILGLDRQEKSFLQDMYQSVKHNNVDWTEYFGEYRVTVRP